MSNRLYFFLLFINTSLFSQTEYKYNQGNLELPDWVQMLYSEEPNAKEIESAFQEYYKVHDYKKNTYTQYYKRWKKEFLKYADRNGKIILPSKKQREKTRSEYLKRLKASQSDSRLVINNWEEIGPWEYDHEATMNLSVQSPGSAHVYTVEQSKSNDNIIYAGTASSGIWKSINKGISWERIGKSLYLSSVYSIEIDNSNSDIIYFAGGNRIWKSIDGGISFIETGNGFWFGWVRDLKMDPSNNEKLFAATDNGLYQTINGGATWNLIANGEFMEIEFQPDNPLILYAVKLIGNRTEFYKSIDGGNTFTLKLNGWPGVESYDTFGAFNALSLDGNSAYGEFSNVPLGSASISNFTIELRVKSAGWNSDPSIISNKNWNSGLNKGFVLAGNTNSNTWKFNIADGTNRMDLNGGTINDNQWHHLAVTYSSNGELKLYQDGVMVNSMTTTITTDADPLLSLGLGQDGTLNYSAFFNGEVNDIRIWNSVLDDLTIQNWRCLELNDTHPFDSSLLNHWKTNEGSGTGLNDSAGNNNGTAQGNTMWTSNNDYHCVNSEMSGTDEQRRIEMAVTPAAPNSVFILATGSINDGSGLYGFYKSTDAGESFTHICCGDGPGGPASITNKNIVGYAFNGDEDGGQYYYDLALDVSPVDSNKVFAAGINVNRSEDGGVSWETNAHWVTWVGSNTKTRYTHADVHDVKFFTTESGVDMWVASDGGLYYSGDQGDTINPRMHGIQGTEFWGFGSSYKEDAMIGGTYHNGTLAHLNDTYLKGKNDKGGWFAGGAADETRGFVHPSSGDVMFSNLGMFQVIDRTMNWNSLPFDHSKNWNANGQPGKYGNYEWDPKCYNHFYSPVGSSLWKTEDNGNSFSLIHDFQTGSIYRVRIALSNPNFIYVVHNDEPNNIVRIWKSVDGGQNWEDVTPPHSVVGNLNFRSKLIDIDQRDENILYLGIVGSSVGNNVFKTTDGGATWINLSGVGLGDEYLLDLSFHQGSSDGLYAGTTNAVYFYNSNLNEWELYNDGLPIKSRCGYLYPYYTKQKMRLGTYSGAYQVDLNENFGPVAKMAVDKLEAICSRDSFYFKDLSYVSDNNRSWLWTFPGANPSTSTLENPVVVYSEAGNYDVTLTVSDEFGSDTQTIENLITINESDCHLDTIPGLTLVPTNTGHVNLGRPNTLDFHNNDHFSFMAWVKPNIDNMTGFILSKYDRYVVGQFQFGIENGKLICTREVQPYTSIGNTSILKNNWYHVAASYDGTELKVYVNGQLDGAINMNGTINSINRDLLVGARYRSGEINDHFDGQIEELSIWSKALTQEEIRELKHLTLDKIEDDHLEAYYQFNESGEIVFDRRKFNHGDLIADGSRENSSCPVGTGQSYRLSVLDGGNYDFIDTGIQLIFEDDVIYPDGELVGFRINIMPDSILNTPTIPKSGYWIINNYGTNQNFDNLSSMQFNEIDVEAIEANNPNVLKLFSRNSNDHGDTWDTNISVDAATLGSDQDGSVVFNNNINSFGQYIIHVEECPDTLLINFSPIEGDTLKAAISISSDGEEFSGSNIVFHAGASINLDAGFTVESGATFLAEIQSCFATTNIVMDDYLSYQSEEDALKVINKMIEKEKIKVEHNTSLLGKVDAIKLLELIFKYISY